PANATTGTTRMRVIVAEGISGAGLTPCLVYTYGETEDYLLDIIVPCSAVIANATVAPTDGTMRAATLECDQGEWTHYYNNNGTGTYTDDVLLLSIKKNN